MSITNLFEWVTEQASLRPEATAVVMRNERLTYRQLEEQSSKLAVLLSEAGCARQDRVALLLPKEPQTIVAMLAVLKCGGIYVPMDIMNPPERAGKIINRAQPSLMLANQKSESLLGGLAGHVERSAFPGIGWMEYEDISLPGFSPVFTRKDFESIPYQKSEVVNSADDTAHILFTSGSTGFPKGVMVTHTNVITFIEWATSYFGMVPEDRVSGHAPLHFDLSTFDIFGTFASGAELHMVPPDIGIVPGEMAEFMATSQLTQWFSVPSLLSYMAKFNVIKHNALPQLKRMIWCGEVFPVSALRYWMQRLPHVQFTNLYGPTETTIASSYYTVPRIPEDDTTEIPIGSACAGEELLILDEHMQPVQPGLIGDLYIRGKGVTRGYWLDDEKTREVFKDSGENGTGSGKIYKTGDLARIGEDWQVYYHGREDAQIKTRGYRVELGEVESGLLRIEIIKECAVVPYKLPGSEDQGIGCAFVLHDPTEGPNTVRLRKLLSAIVPTYALPSKWFAMQQLPRNGNGKIDRKTLTELIENDAAIPSK